MNTSILDSTGSNLKTNVHHHMTDDSISGTAKMAAITSTPTPTTPTVYESVQTALALIQRYSESSPDEICWQNPDHIYQQLDEARMGMQYAWEQQQQKRAVNSHGHNSSQDTKTGTSTDAAASSTTNVHAASTLSHGSDAENENNGNENHFPLVAYMDMITDAFADVLDDLRRNAALDNNNNNKNDEPLDVQVLVDCLQSGLDLFTTLNPGDNNNNNSTLLPYMIDSDFAWNGDFGDDNDEECMNDTQEAHQGTTPLTPHERRRRELGYQVEESTA